MVPDPPDSPDGPLLHNPSSYSGLIWAWLRQTWGNMDDLADHIDDLICSFDHGGPTTMDTVAMLLFGWLIFGLLVFGLGNYVYARVQRGRAEAKVADSVAVEKKKKDAKRVKEDAGKNGAAKEDDQKAELAETPNSKPAVKASASPVQSASVAASLDLADIKRPQPPARNKKPGSIPGTPTTPTNLPGAAPGLCGSPLATGPDRECVAWVNQAFAWAYTQPQGVRDMMDAWALTLNDYTKKAAQETGVVVDILQIDPGPDPPLLKNLFAECDQNDNVTVTCDCETSFSALAKTERLGGDASVVNYKVNVEKMRGRLNIACITSKLICAVKCAGWPEIQLSLEPLEAADAANEREIQERIGEVITAAIRISVLSMNFGMYPDFPHFERGKFEDKGGFSPQFDRLVTSTPVSRPVPMSTTTKRLMVKVVRATNLGAYKELKDPYCVVEMDEPSQKYMTSVQTNQRNPYWDEHFLFDIGSASAELLFEVYDKSTATNNFHGLGIVSVEELVIKPSQRQVISLQPRPYEEHDISGSLTVEFLFMEGTEIPRIDSIKATETQKTVSPSGAIITTTKTTFTKPRDVDILKDVALRELDQSKLGTPNANRTTLIIHSVQREVQRPVVKVEQTEGGEWHEVSDKGPQVFNDGARTTMTTNNSEPSPGEIPSNESDRGRSRRKKRDFFGTIRKRLSRSKNRSQSMDPGSSDYQSVSRDSSMARSVSADRARDDEDNSFSVSGISSASTRTYVNEDSILVLETVENAIKKHYLVPLSIAQKGKWKKKGTKLHIYNDHTFVAKHLPGGMACQVCSKSVARRIGKQGYECRDCQFRCHKHCHVKVDSLCPSSTIHNIELDYLRLRTEE